MIQFHPSNSIHIIHIIHIVPLPVVPVICWQPLGTVQYLETGQALAGGSWLPQKNPKDADVSDVSQAGYLYSKRPTKRPGSVSQSLLGPPNPSNMYITYITYSL
jgi:hypothetical protein